ncbi:hypothetical protein FOZ62_013861 [Perkinsus olseni]|uniref:Uncharacterized protein n=1 Tax=Perkinsus olseni TaxID=32597 RepID=A0A7J6QLI0_PEROL|nr:hypothetical protein FOZ62_013861 [Perkinsus olseni]
MAVLLLPLHGVGCRQSLCLRLGRKQQIVIHSDEGGSEKASMLGIRSEAIVNYHSTRRNNIATETNSDD